MQTTSPRAGRIPADPNRCHHLTRAGARCTMPTLRHKDLCYRHGHRERVLRVKPAIPDDFPRAPIVSFAYMEDHDDVMANLNAIADAFSRHAINHAQASSLTYLMNTALKTLAQMDKIETKITAEEIVRDVTYNDLNQPRAADDPNAPPAPESELIDDEPEEQVLPIRNPGCSLHAYEKLPPPKQIQTLKASADPNPNVSHTYEIKKKQPQSFHTHAENKGRGRGQS